MCGSKSELGKCIASEQHFNAVVNTYKLQKWFENALMACMNSHCFNSNLFSPEKHNVMLNSSGGCCPPLLCCDFIHLIVCCIFTGRGMCYFPE